MKTRISMIILVISAGLFFNSCEKDSEIAGPVVTLIELGKGNSRTAIPGSDLHIEAEIVAEGRIDRITVSIHPEGGHDVKNLHDEGWKADTTFMEFSGLKNTRFHKHLDIPANAKPGQYHFHFTVTDKEGRQTSLEDDFEILQP